MQVIKCKKTIILKYAFCFFLFSSTEVIRTRLREEGSKYKYFFQTARLVAVEEGYAAFYRGLIPQLIRQIPNTAIVLSTYELIVHLLGDASKWSLKTFWSPAGLLRCEERLNIQRLLKAYFLFKFMNAHVIRFVLLVCVTWTAHMT